MTEPIGFSSVAEDTSTKASHHDAARCVARLGRFELRSSLRYFFARASYQYSPFEKGSMKTRLMTLLPGKFSADIRVLIHEVQLTTEHVPIFEALSYA